MTAVKTFLPRWLAVPKVISMSIGGGASSAIENAVNYAFNQGVILVAAAGNDGQSNDVDYPGAYSAVIAVGALTSSKAKASYSDSGPQLDIAAPGSNGCCGCIFFPCSATIATNSSLISRCTSRRDAAVQTSPWL